MTYQSGKVLSNLYAIHPKVDQMAKYADYVEMVKDNITAFLIGWIFGMGLFPVLWEQITASL